MKTYIILLRGVMPVGKNRTPMTQLREVLTKAGFGNARTYIASGNVLIDTKLSIQEAEKQVHDLILKHIGPDLVVIARTGDQLQKVLDENPFTDGYDLKRVFFGSLAEQPSEQKVQELINQDYSPEEVVITENAIYTYIPGNYTRSRLAGNFIEKKLGVSTTFRNFNTMTRLIEMSKMAE
jgi:uncharacterized protein (DUF1697 family)